jgi:hypothetical protein
MHGRRSRERCCGLGGLEVFVARTAHGPERCTLGDVVEAEDLFHSAVAVGRHDHDGTGKVTLGVGNAQNQIVMELALGPMIDELERSPAHPHFVEERTKHERMRELGDDWMFFFGRGKRRWGGRHDLSVCLAWRRLGERYGWECESTSTFRKDRGFLDRAPRVVDDIRKCLA